MSSREAARKGGPEPTSAPVSAARLQRACACGQHTPAGGACIGCSRDRVGGLQRLAVNHEPVGGLPAVVDQVLGSPGESLDGPTRTQAETRFGHDFSRVRVHTDQPAAESARTVNALAYTVGRDMVFGAGQYAPGTAAGRRLIAHELAHVVQQAAGPGGGGEQAISAPSDHGEQEAERVSRAESAGPASLSASPLLVARQTPTPGPPGSSILADRAQAATQTPSGVWEGTVERSEYANPAAQAAGQPIHRDWVKLRYDPSACRVTVPVTVSFRQAAAADLQACPPEAGQGGPTPMDSADFNRVAQAYVDAVNTTLNGWYTATIDGCTGQPCAGKNIPIQVEVTRATANPDYTVVITGLKGRSCVQPSGQGQGTVLLYNGSIDRRTMAHEGVHMALGHGDEYREQDPSKPRPIERVREGDWSLAADYHAFGSWSLLHERHFNFVPVFLNDVLQRAGHPSCRAKLQELTRPKQLAIRIPVSGGYASYGGGGVYFGAGLELGVPLNRLREWQLILGAHGRMISSLEFPSRRAYLLGVRMGLERSFTPSSGGARIGGFGEAGAGSFQKGFEPSQRGSYLEGGVSLGYGTAPLAPGASFLLSAEAAAGTRLDATNSEARRWFRAGLLVGIEW